MKIGITHCGGGGTTIGAINAGLSPAWGIEYDEAIAAHYASQLGAHVIVNRVECVDPHALEPVDVLSCSPPCPNFSIANAGRKEMESDTRSAQAIVELLRVLRPRAFMLENVGLYRKSQSFTLIINALAALGYQYDYGLLDAADFGVPQNRRRLILRAVRDALLPPLPPKIKPHRGWYSAIEDLIPTLPDSRFAAWQMARIPAELRTLLMSINGEASDYRDQGEPAPTVAANHGSAKYRALLCDSENVRSNGKSTMREPDDPAFARNTYGTGKRPKAYVPSQQSLLLMTGNSGHCDSPEGTGCLDPDAPANTVASNSIRNSKAYLVGNQQGAGEAGNRQPMVTPENEPSPAVSASLPSKGKLPHALLVAGNSNENSRGDNQREGEEPSFAVTGNAVGRVRAFLVSNMEQTIRESTVSDQREPSETVRATAMRRPITTPKVFLVDGKNTKANDDQCTVLDSDDPAFCVGATAHKGLPKAFEGGRVVSLTPRALARFMGFPDWYVLPSKTRLACTILGNAVCPPLAEVLLRQLAEAIE